MIASIDVFQFMKKIGSQSWPDFVDVFEMVDSRDFLQVGIPKVEAELRPPIHAKTKYSQIVQS